jgi:DNA polymerase-3 subunit beta
MTLSAGRSRFTLATLPREDFPSTGAADLPNSFEMQAPELRNLIDRTRFAISTEETRYYLNGIYLHAAESDDVKVLRAVATDGHRLARFEMPLPDGAESLPGVIVPRKAVNELRKLIDDADVACRVELSETRIRFAFDSTVLTSKLIDGTFPDYQRVIPAGNDKLMKVDCKSFAAAVDRVSTISTEKSRAVKLSMNNGALTLSATSPENGSATEEIEVDYDGEAIEIGFNSRYLLDIATQIEGEGAEFALSDAASPTIIRDIGDKSALYVLMPMRV